MTTLLPSSAEEMTQGKQKAASKVHRRRKKWIEEAFASVMSDFGLLPCHISFEDAKDDTTDPDFNRAMGIRYNYPYPQLSVILFSGVYDMEEEELKRSVFHEVMHVLLWELKHFRKQSDAVWRDLEEKVVEKLAVFFVASKP